MVREDLGRDAKVSGQERAAQLGHQLFLGVAFITEPDPPKIARQARAVLGPVDQLMGEGRGVAFGIAEGLKVNTCLLYLNLSGMI